MKNSLSFVLILSCQILIRLQVGYSRLNYPRRMPLSIIVLRGGNAEGEAENGKVAESNVDVDSQIINGSISKGCNNTGLGEEPVTTNDDEEDDPIDYLQFFNAASGFGDDFYEPDDNDPDHASYIMGEEGIYGEILPESLRRLLTELPHINIDENDVMYDLGAGVGKIVAQFAFETPVKRAVGIELGERRHALSVEILHQLQATGHPDINKIEYIRDDVGVYPWYEDATILFINGLFFSVELMEDILLKIKSACPSNFKYIFMIGNKVEVEYLNDPTCNNYHFVEEWYACPASFADDCLCALYINQNATKDPLLDAVNFKLGESPPQEEW